MFPVLFEIPAVAAWVLAVAAAALGVVFYLLGRRDAEDRSSWWMAGICGIAAVGVLAYKGPTAELGPLPIRFFGILVVGGFLAATKLLSWRNARKGLLSGEESFDLAFYALLLGLVGGRMLHVIQNFDTIGADGLPLFKGRPHRILYLWDGGLVWYGGAVAGMLFAWYWLAKRRKDLWAISDSLAVALPLGHAIGRIGCFLAGCDYGRVVAGGRDALPWAVHFPVEGPRADYTLVPMEFRYDFENDVDLWVHPVQLYLFLMNLAVCGILLWLDRRNGKGAFPGRLVAVYLMLYAVGRGVIEHWRGDADRGTYDLGGLEVSFSQIVSVLVLAGGFLLYRGLKGRHHAPPAPERPQETKGA